MEKCKHKHIWCESDGGLVYQTCKDCGKKLSTVSGVWNDVKEDAYSINSIFYKNVSYW